MSGESPLPPQPMSTTRHAHAAHPNPSSEGEEGGDDVGGGRGAHDKKKEEDGKKERLEAQLSEEDEET